MHHWIKKSGSVKAKVIQPLHMTLTQIKVKSAIANKKHSDEKVVPFITNCYNICSPPVNEPYPFT